MLYRTKRQLNGYKYPTRCFMNKSTPVLILQYTLLPRLQDLAIQCEFAGLVTVKCFSPSPPIATTSNCPENKLNCQSTADTAHLVAPQSFVPGQSHSVLAKSEQYSILPPCSSNAILQLGLSPIHSTTSTRRFFSGLGILFFFFLSFKR